jgi:hypothetical protein
MGTLRKFDLERVRRHYGCVSFVETGTGSGHSLEYATGCGFKSIHSIEIVVHLAEAARFRFSADKRVEVWRGETSEALPKVLKGLSNLPCLFWLDAHFPNGADYGLGEYGADDDLEARFPLEREIELIKAARPDCKDVILIDDARMYVDGNFSAGALPKDWPPLRGLNRNIDFIRKAFAATHGIVVDHADHGYIMVCPRL